MVARAAAALMALALCWPMAGALAAAATAPAQHACCMRSTHGCHSHQQEGNSVQAICHACGWCHALPNARAHLSPTTFAFSFSIQATGIAAEAAFQFSFETPRLHSSRAPPRSESLA